MTPLMTPPAAGPGAGRRSARRPVHPGPAQRLCRAAPTPALLAALVCLLTACGHLGGEPAPERASWRPALALPADWGDAAVPAQAEPAQPVPVAWWQAFGHPALGALMAEADQGSATLVQARERLRQAELALAQSRASLWPTLGLSASTSASRNDPADGAATSRRASNLGLSISYETDLWGRLAAGREADAAALASSRFDLAAARLTLQASVASTYLGWLAQGERLRLAQHNLALAERVLTIVEAKHRAGVATPLEVSQQRTTVLSQRAALLPLQLSLRQSATALALLLGRVPQGYQPPAGQLAEVSVPAPAAVLPAELLSRRPDLAVAEAALWAADANVRAARAALLPSVSLSAGASLGSAVAFNLADPTQSLSLGLSLAHSLFDGGQRDAAVQISQSQQVALVAAYAAAVRTALKEVDDSLGSADSTRRQTEAQHAVVDQARRSLALAEAQYRAGSGNLLAVLEAQRSLFSAEDSLASLRLARLTAAVNLFKALGGGWRTV